jgi:hypothetical protein
MLDGYANVYFMRSVASYGSRVWPAILLNGQRAAPLPIGAYSVVGVAPGKYKVTMKKEQAYSGAFKASTEIDISAGQTYYLEYSHPYHASTGVYALNGVAGAFSENVPEEERWIVHDQASAEPVLRGLMFVKPYTDRLP